MTAALANTDNSKVYRTARDVTQGLRSSKLYMDLQALAQEKVSKSDIHLSEVRKEIRSSLESTVLYRKLQNYIFKYIRTHEELDKPEGVPAEHLKEPLPYLLKAQKNWEKRILKSLNTMCTELNIPLAKKRLEKDAKEMISKWTELGTDNKDLSQIRPVYAPKDFLEVIINIQNPNRNNNGILSLWGFVQVPLGVKTVQQLRLQYCEMAINQCQTGIDDAPEVPPELFEEERMRFGKKVLNMNLGPVAEEFSKRGCPVSLRADLWCQMLGIELDAMDVLKFEQLKSYVFKHELLTDNLFYKDIKLTATNDDQYFVFEDFLYQILLPFSRDSSIVEHFRRSSGTPPKSYIRGKLGIEEFMVTYPPSGVIPFHGFSMYVCPLCYLYNETVRLYFVFREMYTRYFFRLHCISSHPEGIMALSLQFEMLLQALEPELFFHFKKIGCQPLRIAFKWLMRAFSGYLASDQVLLLWDRILAFNSLHILPVLAVAIFSFRKTNLLKVTSLTAAEGVLADLMTLQVIPMIQLTLFSN